MADVEEFAIRDISHVRIENFQDVAGYVFPKRRQTAKPLRDDYAAHADALLVQLAEALGPIPSADADTRLSIPGLKPGVLVEIETQAPKLDTSGPAKIPTNLQFAAEDIVVLKSERLDRTESAVVFVPDDARAFLASRLENYGKDPGNERRPDIEKFEPLETFARADALALFTPPLQQEILDPVWWELWVREAPGRADLVAAAAQNAGLDVHADRLQFPDIVVLHVLGPSKAVLQFLSRAPGAFVEVRRATDTIQVFLQEGRDAGLGPADHVAELLARVTPPSQDAPVICVLDSGVSAAHPLIAMGMTGAWTFDEAWGTDDHIRHGGHGTGLVGLVLYGDLFAAMADQRELRLTHSVESVKYLTPPGFPQPTAPSYGAITQGAVAIAELNGGERARTFCIASSTDLWSATQPSSWSGALDQLASGATLADRSTGEPPTKTAKRLIVVAAGNVQGGQRQAIIQQAAIEDPAQSWNALTIGGYTAKDTIEPFELGVRTLAETNDVSPFSRGSNTLAGDLTPIKPEVLFEAGNMAVDGGDNCDWRPSLSVLAAGSDVLNEPLLPFWATSAAAGMAGNYLGRLKAELPGLWPETYRALTVHSADWIGPMRPRLIGRGLHWKGAKKGPRQQILREIGYGVPDLSRAVKSAKNDMVLLAQAEIQPYSKAQDGATATYNEIHFYDLPWPKSALEALENEPVIMKITLSYFIEPNLSGRAATRPDTYRSCGLRFAMKKRNESIAAFKKRYAAALAAEKEPAVQEKDCWLLGPNAIAAGSLHCDLWRGPAIDLAGHDAIAIYPVGGWWKSHLGQRRMNDKARYALAISIDGRALAVDLQNEITQQVNAKEIEILLRG
ncbi:MAG TPA: S8 family peptidase [Caulobacteraceae bacterium]|jgi:hypothetical protein